MYCSYCLRGRVPLVKTYLSEEGKGCRTDHCVCKLENHLRFSSTKVDLCFYVVVFCIVFWLFPWLVVLRSYRWNERWERNGGVFGRKKYPLEEAQPPGLTSVKVRPQVLEMGIHFLLMEEQLPHCPIYHKLLFLWGLVNIILAAT